MQQEDLRPWAEQVQTYHMPRYDELPAIDLYMDQVVAILEDCLRLFLRDAQEKRITPAMINNYVKLKVLPPPVKKRYTFIVRSFNPFIHNISIVINEEDVVLYDLKRQQEVTGTSINGETIFSVEAYPSTNMVYQIKRLNPESQ